MTEETTGQLLILSSPKSGPSETSWETRGETCYRTYWTFDL